MFPHKEIRLSDEIRAHAPGLRVLAIEASISNGPTTDALRDEMGHVAGEIVERYEIGDINHRSGIAATRAAYKACGKDPNRYRPSQEQLCRRIIQGKELYYISQAVDAINIISIKSGYAIGGFDADKIGGECLTLGVGCEGEPYEGIGRGSLNIAGMPVYRDAIGGVGTPTSDNERTKLSNSTRHLLMTVNMYGEEMAPSEVEALTRSLLERHCSLTYFNATIID
ncbi:MAG: phenylalanine--tRNA ligase beta subunit-related protein [Pseudoflavonifractor sp.]|nr:phenylalanine--tRNA ligase beta subunit-related protein [Alloprevotella sp.]MCM1117663.1 phenylalanine--tRNA ligase beta subunit-related protein [Pseudoflavonifractor sp.]